MTSNEIKNKNNGAIGLNTHFFDIKFRVLSLVLIYGATCATLYASSFSIPVYSCGENYWRPIKYILTNLPF